MIRMSRSRTLQSVMLGLSVLVSSALGQSTQFGPDSARFAVRTSTEDVFRLGGETITVQTQLSLILELRIVREGTTGLRVRTRIDSIAYSGASADADVDIGVVPVKRGDTVAFTIGTTGGLESVQSSDSAFAAMLHQLLFGGLEIPRRCEVLPCSWDSDPTRLPAASIDGFGYDPAVIASSLAGRVRQQLSDTNVAGSRMVRLETSSLERAPGKPISSFHYWSVALIDASGRLTRTNATSTIEVDPASGTGEAPVRASTSITVERLPGGSRD